MFSLLMMQMKPRQAKKISNYADPPTTCIFQTLLLETQSANHSSALKFLNAERAIQFQKLEILSWRNILSWQRTSVLIQRFNVNLISETFVADETPY